MEFKFSLKTCLAPALMQRSTIDNVVSDTLNPDAQKHAGLQCGTAEVERLL